MQKNEIVIRGARANNLKNIDVTIPRDQLVVMTGLSGSGKSSLAFDTIYADGQRRYVESLSSYARMFLGQMEKPDVDSIEGLSPAISIDQKTTSKNPRSTVGTVTEIYDYLRLLYARIGIPHCPVCGREISQQSIDEVVDQILALPEGTKFQLLAPIVRGKKGQYIKELERARKSGFSRVRIDGIQYDLSEEIKLDKNIKHTIEIVVDRLIIKDGITSRLTDSLETTAALTGGIIHVDVIGGEMMSFSQNYACPEHNISMEELTPRLFSFNNPLGACEKCTGLGMFQRIDPDLVLPNPSLSILGGAIHASGWNHLEEGSIAMMYYNAIAEKYGISLDTPVEQLPKEVVDTFLYGTKGEKLLLHRSRDLGGGAYFSAFEGVIPNLERRYQETSSVYARADLEDYMGEVVCEKCNGARLKPEVLSVTVGGLNIYELTQLSVSKALEFFRNLKLTEHENFIGERIIKEICDRLGFLSSVGLAYLTLSRAAGTLSGGESQRINLAKSLGSSLVGSLYVLDEPSIGLHPRDTERLIHVLKELRDLGNTIVVVEHDEDIIAAADHIIEIGPAAGRHGGEVVYEGKPRPELFHYEIPAQRRHWNNYIEIEGACENNLKNLTVRFPLHVMTVVTGVSGSGKSSLVSKVLYPALKKHYGGVFAEHTGDFGHLRGSLQLMQDIEFVDQNPLSRSSRSNPVTYLKAYDEIRRLFAEQPLSKQLGLTPAHFSFNTPGGRCETCQGEGTITIEMQFMADLVLECEQCHGKRFKQDILDVHYRGKSIYDILCMTVNQAVEFFSEDPDCAKIVKRLKPLQDVGIGYVQLGQSSSTLSGGESQRVKLASFLAQEENRPTIFVFDEPTTGLHHRDIEVLLKALNRLISKGHTVIIIEHNPAVILAADHVIDLGPEGGKEGGQIVCEGTPETVAACKESYTGKYIAQIIQNTKQL